MNDQRGVALLDMLVGCTILALVSIATATVFGLQPNRTHVSAVALEGALAEARSLAASTANATNLGYPTGSTVVVEPDIAHAGHSTIAVYRSRPAIVDGIKPLAVPSPDAAFPVQHVIGTFQFTGTVAGAGTTIDEPFIIMMNSGGYVSVESLGGATYNATAPVIYASDPGCPSGAQISAISGSQREPHAFNCNGGAYLAN